MVAAGSLRTARAEHQNQCVRLGHKHWALEALQNQGGGRLSESIVYLKREGSSQCFTNRFCCIYSKSGQLSEYKKPIPLYMAGASSVLQQQIPSCKINFINRVIAVLHQLNPLCITKNRGHNLSSSTTP